MKIGILIRDFDALRNWELRIIEGIRKSPALELNLLIKDGRQDINTGQSKLRRALKSKNFLGKIVFTLQTKIESLIFKEKHTEDRAKIVSYLQQIKTIELAPVRKGFLDIFSSADADIVRKYELDILLRHQFNIIRGDILTACRYGIWSFHHGDNAINRGGPAGFWEIILKNPVVGVTLQKLTPELDGGLIIDKAYYNTSFSAVKNNNKILEHSVSLLFKNIGKLERNEFNPVKSPVYYNPLYRNPSARVTLGYMAGFYFQLCKLAVREVFQRLLGVRYDCWTLFIGKGSIFDATLFRLKPVKLPKGEFWADPFLYKHKGELYVFFENYSYKKRSGKISCGKVVGKEITDVIDVLDLDYHLSYPFIFEEDNDIYMIPETHQKRRLVVYKCAEFPNKWELYTTAFEGESVADATYFKDESGQRWLFLNKGFDDDHMAELYIYRIDSLKFVTIEEHHQNPVIIDSRIGRNAGAIFKYNNKLIRPSQNNSKNIYGYGLNLNAIRTLTIEKYEEDLLIGIEPNFIKGLRATHHLHQLDDVFIIDGAFNKRY
jgi:hypothetical protein